ncbi:hypothetical protein VIGAN_05233600, partial [Vigna angularis var. angularis]
EALQRQSILIHNQTFQATPRTDMEEEEQRVQTAPTLCRYFGSPFLQSHRRLHHQINHQMFTYQAREDEHEGEQEKTNTKESRRRRTRSQAGEDCGAVKGLGENLMKAGKEVRV